MHKTGEDARHGTIIGFGNWVARGDILGFDEAADACYVVRALGRMAKGFISVFLSLMDPDSALL